MSPQVPEGSLGAGRARGLGGTGPCWPRRGESPCAAAWQAWVPAVQPGLRAGCSRVPCPLSPRGTGTPPGRAGHVPPAPGPCQGQSRLWAAPAGCSSAERAQLHSGSAARPESLFQRLSCRSETFLARKPAGLCQVILRSAARGRTQQPRLSLLHCSAEHQQEQLQSQALAPASAS